MRKAVSRPKGRIIAAYLLYWAGDAVSRANWVFNRQWGWWLYNRLMLASSEMQGPGEDGPWSRQISITDE